MDSAATSAVLSTLRRGTSCVVVVHSSPVAPPSSMIVRSVEIECSVSAAPGEMHPTIASFTELAPSRAPSVSKDSRSNLVRVASR